MEIICFHNPNEENGYLSNWHESYFMEDKVTFSSMKQYMMYKKAIYFNDGNIAENILDTGDAVLAECAVKDRIWGIRLSMNDSDRFDSTKWKGQNLLGYALMMVRNSL